MKESLALLAKMKKSNAGFDAISKFQAQEAVDMCPETLVMESSVIPCDDCGNKADMWLGQTKDGQHTGTIHLCNGCISTRSKAGKPPITGRVGYVNGKPKLGIDLSKKR